MKIEIRQIEHAEEKRTICRAILEALPEWFGIPEAREEYIRESADGLFFAAMDGEKPVGFLYLKETGRDTVAVSYTHLDVYKRQVLSCDTNHGFELLGISQKLLHQRSHLNRFGTSTEDQHYFLLHRFLPVKYFIVVKIPYFFNPRLEFTFLQSFNDQLGIFKIA